MLCCNELSLLPICFLVFSSSRPAAEWLKHAFKIDKRMSFEGFYLPNT